MQPGVRDRRNARTLRDIAPHRAIGAGVSVYAPTTRGALFEAGSRIQIADIMSKPVYRVAPSVEAEAAWQLMRKARIRHLVIVDGHTVVGVVTDRDLGSSYGESVRKARIVSDVLDPNTDIRDAAKLFRNLAIGCFPVIADQQLVGIITTSDWNAACSASRA